MLEGFTLVVPDEVARSTTEGLHVAALAVAAPTFVTSCC